MQRTFRIGGIHPPESKMSAGRPIEVLPIPQVAVIPLGQHIGAPAQAVVAKGDEVKVGTLIAKSGGFVSANIHSPVSGKVAKIDTIFDSSGYKKPAIFINVEGDEWEASIDRSTTIKKECVLSSKEIIDKIAEMGIVGMGGATFPTHVKLSPPPGQKATVLIINAVECEPYLTSDDALMREHAEEIMIGCTIVMKAIDVQETLIGIEVNKPEAIREMERVASSYPGIKIIPLKKRYPQGGEKQLIDAVIRRQVSSGALPISTGAVVQNVGTIYAIYEAVQKNKPLIERVVTVTGDTLSKPSNLMVRMGTPMIDLINHAGGMPEDAAKIIGGGPMMGRALVNAEVPITKGSSGLLLLSRKATERGEMRDCVRCGKCVGVCPMGLNPAFLMRDTAVKNWDSCESMNVVDCIECGSCSFTCPADRPLLDYIRIGKQTVMGIIRTRKQ